MKKHILFLIFVIFSTTILYAQESIKINIYTPCSESNKKEISIKISSNRLKLSEDAIQDNTGGYVDIPEDSYYLKTDNHLYHLRGVVEHSIKNNINQFTSYIDNNSKRFINIEELYSLKSNKGLKFIQKIVLQENNKIDTMKTNTTTTILDVYFDENAIKQEYQKCEEQMKQPKTNLYLQALLFILLIFGMLYLFKRKFKN